MSRTKNIKLSFAQLCWHYSIVPFLLITPLMDVWYLLNDKVLKEYSAVRDSTELTPISLFFVALSILFYFMQRHRLKFKEFDLPYTDEGFNKALEETAEELKWKITERRKGYVRAYRKWEGTLSWGELITIKCENGRILINSICNPDAIFISVISNGWNRKNTRVFIDNLSKQTKSGHELSFDK